jgi:hypothetical protein
MAGMATLGTDQSSLIANSSQVGFKTNSSLALEVKRERNRQHARSSREKKKITFSKLQDRVNLLEELAKGIMAPILEQCPADIRQTLVKTYSRLGLVPREEQSEKDGGSGSPSATNSQGSGLGSSSGSQNSSGSSSNAQPPSADKAKRQKIAGAGCAETGTEQLDSQELMSALRQKLGLQQPQK